MKKILALAIVAMMAFACVFSASAAETTLPDVDSPAWWTGHTEGVAVDEAGVTFTFTVTAYESATGNFNGPYCVLYAADEAKVNGAGYVEYWVGRGDAAGWSPAANTWAGMETLNANGITYTSTGIDGWVGWDNFLATLKAGTDGKVTAKLEDGKVTIVMEVCGLQSTAVIPVESGKPVYISLFGELATLTNIKVITPDPVVDDNVPTGDLIVLPIALMCICAGAVLTLKKKVG